MWIIVVALGANCLPKLHLAEAILLSGLCCAATRCFSVVTHWGATDGCSGCDWGEPLGFESWKPCTSLSEPAPPVLHAGCIFRSLSPLVKTEGISPASSAFSLYPVSLERSQMETSPRRVWNGSAGQLGMPVRQPACSLPSPWLSLRFVALCFLVAIATLPTLPLPYTKHPDLSWTLYLIPRILYIGINLLVTVGELGGRRGVHLSLLLRSRVALLWLLVVAVCMCLGICV